MPDATRSGCCVMREAAAPAAPADSEKTHTAQTSSPQSAECQCWLADTEPMHRASTAARQRLRMQQRVFKGNPVMAQRQSFKNSTRHRGSRPAAA